MIRAVGTCQGRALLVTGEGVYYASLGEDVVRSTDCGRSWHLDCEGAWPRWARRRLPRLAARLLRRYVAALAVLPSGARVLIRRDGVYRAAPDDRHAIRSFTVTRGSRPLNLAVDEKGRVFFGEYGSGLESGRVRVYGSDDEGASFHVAYEFPTGAIRHIHNVIPDGDGYLVLCGDFGEQPGIARLDASLQAMDWVVRGSQLARAVSALVDDDSITYGTDSDREPNFIVRVEKRSGRIDKLCSVEGSSLYAAEFGGLRLISTCVEPNVSGESKFAAIYGSLDGGDFTLIRRHLKDRWHPVLFQFGTAVLPRSEFAGNHGFYSGQALQGLDGQAELFVFDGIPTSKHS